MSLNFKLLFIPIFLSLLLPLSAQRYLPKTSSLEINGGLLPIKESFTVGTNYAFITKKKNHWKIGGHWLRRTYALDQAKVSLDQYTVEGGFYYMFLSDPSKSFFMSVGLSAVTGYEIINKGKRTLANGSTILAKDKWIYGGVLSLEMEYYFSDNYIALLNIRERILAGSEVNFFNTEFSLGIKFIIDFNLMR